MSISMVGEFDHKKSVRARATWHWEDAGFADC